MILLNINQTDYLVLDKRVEYFDKFISKYSFITVSSNLCQGSLIPENNEQRIYLESDIYDFLKEMPNESNTRRRNYRHFALSAGLNVGNLVQDSEKRNFTSDYFIGEAEKNKISPRELGLRVLNSHAFLQYYFLLEESLRDLFIELHRDYDVKKIKNSQAITLCLKKRLEKSNNLTPFIQQLSDRSKFFLNWKVLTLMWELFTLIRNRCVHYNNNYDKKSLSRLHVIINNIRTELNEKEDLLLTSLYFSNSWGDVLEKVESDGYMLFNDTLENMIRNTSIFVMESLSLCESK